MIKKVNDYTKFIDSCKTKVYLEMVHKHHIIPKFMGGTDDLDNIIELSVNDHFKAHMLLAENCDPQYRKGNLWSVAMLKKGWSGDVDLIIEKLRESNSGESNPFYGRAHTNESKEKISESHSYWFKGKTYEEMYGEGRANEIRRKVSESKMGERNPSKRKEVKESIRKSLNEHYNDDSNRKKQSQTMKDFYQTEDGIKARKRMSEAAKNRKRK